MNRQIKVYCFKPASGGFDFQGIANLPATNKPTGVMIAYNRRMYDVILFVVTCKTHQHKMLLKELRKSCYYMPLFPLKLTSSWRDQITFYLGELFKSASIKTSLSSVDVSLLQMNQIRLPKYLDLVHQLVVHVRLDKCSGECDSSVPLYKWYSKDKLTVNGNDMWGPEPFLYWKRATDASTDRKAKCNELSISRELKQNPNRWKMAKNINYTEEDVTSLYSNFIQLCYPSQFMNEVIHTDYMDQSRINLMVNSSVSSKSRLFNSFCITSGSYVTFKDFLFSIVALDRRCLHGDVGGELRTRCIFRYYAKFEATSIDFAELVNLYVDIAATHKNERKEDAPAAAEGLFKQLGLDKNKQSIEENKFVDLVGSLVIRGTSNVYRSASMPLLEIRQKKIFAAHPWPQEVAVDRLVEKKSLPLQKSKPCSRCEKSNYLLAIHSMLLNPANGQIDYFQELPSELTTKYSKPIRAKSLDVINPQQIYNQLRDTLRRFSFERHGFPPINSDSNNGPKWEKKQDRTALIDTVFKVCLEAKDILRKGPRVLKCSSPIFVFGDIHGNFKDLMIFDHLFWRMAPHGFVANCLFLGDYVDRGEHSVECVLYLLCMKMLMPSKIHLLRGNHEVRVVQQMFTFQRECFEKFGYTSGRLIWEAFNQVFDVMPLCGIVDEQIFCAHGGIPATVNRVESLYTIPAPLPNPNGTNKPAWEMLWNDPITEQEYKAFANMFNRNTGFPIFPQGFAPNSKRGTAYYYNEDGLDAFIELNDLNFLIRAHEVIPNGFQFTMDGKMMTIFSCSNYCGANNEAAVVYIDDGKMRVVKIETNQKFQEFKQ